nr:cytochrome c-type biogenesis protein [Saccharobesus litoralis]
MVNAEVHENYQFETDKQQTLFLQLTKELRCPKCQNQNIADSNAGVALDLKNKTYQLVKEGKSKDDVIDYMVQRYGNFVTYKPPVNTITIWLWLGPALVAGLLFTTVVVRSRRKHPSLTDDSESKPVVEQSSQPSSAALQQARELLSKNKQQGAKDD